MTGRQGLRLRYCPEASEVFSKEPSGLKWSLRGATIWLRPEAKGVNCCEASDWSGKGVLANPRLLGLL